MKHEQPPELESVELDVRHGRGRERGRLDSDNDDAGPAVDLSAYSPKKMSVPSTTVKRKVPPMKRMSTGSFDEATAVRQLVIPEARSNFADFRKVLLLQFRAFITPPDLLDELLEYYLEPILTEKKSSRTISDDDPDYQKLGDGSGRLVWVPHVSTCSAMIFAYNYSGCTGGCFYVNKRFRITAVMLLRCAQKSS